MKKNKSNDYWLIPLNEKKFNLVDCLKANHCVHWKSSFKPKPNEIVFIYITQPKQQICYKMIVREINIPFENVTNEVEYWKKEELPKPNISTHRLELIQVLESEELHLNRLLEHGLKRAPQGPMKLRNGLFDYVNSIFVNHIVKYDYDELEEKDIKVYYEGALKRVYVNRYERDQNAREECIKAHGCKCSVCGMDFEKMYGELGKGFIHVHHIVPLASIGKEYQINPVEHMVPVCPNCHAMLHRGKDGKVLRPDELKDEIKKV